MSRIKSHSFSFLLLSVFSSLLLTGCIGTDQWVWQHAAGFDVNIRQQTIHECESIAKDEARRFDFYFLDPYYYERFYYRGMHYPFFYPYYGFDSYREFQLRRGFFNVCMKAKGWRLVRQPLQNQGAP